MIQKCINCKEKFEDGQEGEQEDFLCVSCDSAWEPYPDEWFSIYRDGITYQGLGFEGAW